MATDDYSHYTCELAPQCTISITGICLKGHKDSPCSYLVDEHDELEDEDLEEEEDFEEEDLAEEENSKDEGSDLLNAHDSEDEEDESTKTVDSTYFGSGEALPESGIQTITYAFPTKLIVLIGGVGCGKTTLVASIVEAFQKGPLGGFIFAGSRTQIGFEQRSHRARRGAGRVKPDTERTKSIEFFHLHLSIRDELAAGHVQHLLFTDVSGERFKSACETDAEMQSLTVLKRADRIFYVVDGEALSSLDDRFQERADVELFLDRAIQNNLLSEENKLTILINKFDAVSSDEEEAELESFFTTSIREQFAAVVAGVHVTVARPSEGSRITDTLNLDILLQLSAHNREHSSEASSHLVVDHPREFYRLFSE